MDISIHRSMLIKRNDQQLTTSYAYQDVRAAQESHIDTPAIANGVRLE